MKTFNMNHLKRSIIHIPVIATVIFVLLLAVAMSVYPGGTENDIATEGYIFSQNYISDLGRTISPSGDNNMVSFMIFLAAFGVMTAAFFNYYYKMHTFYISSYHMNSNALKLGTFFGMCTSLCFIGVALTPANMNMKDHIMFAEWLFRFLFASTCLHAFAFYQKKETLLMLSFAHLLMAIGTGLYILFSDLKFNSLFFDDIHKAEVISQKLIVGFLITGILMNGYSHSKNLKNV